MVETLASGWADLTKPKLRTINVELSAYCDRRCPSCLNPTPAFRRKGHMSPELVEKLLTEVEPEVKMLLCGAGECSLHPDFIDILHKFTSRFQVVTIVTNGLLLSCDRLVEGVLRAAPTKINVSMHSTATGDLSTPELLRQLKEFVRRRRALRSRVFLQINYLSHGPEDDYVALFERLDNTIHDDWCMCIKQVRNLAGQLGFEERPAVGLLDEKIRPHIGRKIFAEDWSAFLDRMPRPRRPGFVSCRHVYSYYVLLYNGDVVPCFNDQNARMILCNAVRDGIHLGTVLQSPQHQAFRARLAGDDKERPLLCDHCSDLHKYFV
jgi:hypothetical protein